MVTIRHFYFGLTFTGQMLDNDAGLYYYGARWYEPVIGKFITPDSLIQAPYDPQTLNRYAYVRNNPIKYVDPTGHSIWSDFWRDFENIIQEVMGDISESIDKFLYEDLGLPSNFNINAGISKTWRWGDEGGSSSGGGQENGGTGTPTGVPYNDGNPGMVKGNSQILLAADPEGSWAGSLYSDPTAEAFGNDVIYNYGSYYEVWSGGTRAWRNNNPGNIRPGTFANRYGSIGKAGGFAVFSNYQIGFNALESLLRTRTYSSLTVNQAIARYAPNFENGTIAYQEFVSRTTGINPNTLIGSLTSQQIRSVANAIQLMEGYRVGTIRRYYLDP